MDVGRDMLGDMTAVAYRLRVPSQGVTVPVYEGESEEEALERAAREVPSLRERATRTAAQRASGRRTGRSLDEVYARHGLERPEAGTRGKKGTPNGSIPLRVPVSVHRDLVERARREGVSVNQLVLSFIGRGLGFRESTA